MKTLILAALVTASLATGGRAEDLRHDYGQLVMRSFCTNASASFLEARSAIDRGATAEEAAEVFYETLVTMDTLTFQGQSPSVRVAVRDYEGSALKVVPLDLDQGYDFSGTVYKYCFAALSEEVADGQGA